MCLNSKQSPHDEDDDEDDNVIKVMNYTFQNNYFNFFSKL